MKIPKELKRAVNRLAHAAGLAHAERFKLRMLDDIARRIDEGESVATIAEFLAARNAVAPLKSCRRYAKWQFQHQALALVLKGGL